MGAKETDQATFSKAPVPSVTAKTRLVSAAPPVGNWAAAAMQTTACVGPAPRLAGTHPAT